MLVLYHSRQFAMSHGSYNSILSSEILILVGDIRARSWPNIGGTYGTLCKKRGAHLLGQLLWNRQYVLCNTNTH